MQALTRQSRLGLYNAVVNALIQVGKTHTLYPGYMVHYRNHSAQLGPAHSEAKCDMLGLLLGVGVALAQAQNITAKSRVCVNVREGKGSLRQCR